MRTATPPDLPGLISGGQARRRRRNAVLAGGSVLALVVAAGGVYGVTQIGGDDDSVPRITHRSTVQPMPDAGSALAAGTYVVGADADYVVAPYTITVPTGWQARDGDELSKGQEGSLVIDAFALDKIRLADDTCRGGETFGAPQTSVNGLMAGLRAQGSGLRVSDPVAATVGGLAATRIDLAYPAARPLPNCRASASSAVQPGALQVWTGYFVLFPSESARVYVVEVDGRAQMFLTKTPDDASAADRAELQSILDSISFRTEAQ